MTRIGAARAFTLLILLLSLDVVLLVDDVAQFVHCARTFLGLSVVMDQKLNRAVFAFAVLHGKLDRMAKRLIRGHTFLLILPWYHEREVVDFGGVRAEVLILAPLVHLDDLDGGLLKLFKCLRGAITLVVGPPEGEHRRKL